MRLLKSRPISIPLQDRKHNPINGSDAESFAASMLVSACRAEVRWGSREEDGSKIDLFLSCEHPWHNKERLILLVQVKSGSSYGRQNDKGFTLKKTSKVAALKTAHSICVVWVNRDTGHCFWAYIHPNSNSSDQDYGEHHRITPATIFDIARCSGKFTLTPSGGSGITVRKRSSNLETRRTNVKKTYKELGRSEIISPVLGSVELTRLAWRHIFRRSRLSRHKETSLDAIPYIVHFLRQLPSQHRITSVEYFQEKDLEYRSTEHLLQYRKARIYDPASQSYITDKIFFFRLIEEVRYPINWSEKVMLSQIVERRVVLASVYYK